MKILSFKAYGFPVTSLQGKKDREMKSNNCIYYLSAVAVRVRSLPAANSLKINDT